jgi:hypothetical protein
VKLPRQLRLRQQVTRGPAPAPPVPRWRSSSSNQHRPGGGPSTHLPLRAGPCRRGNSRTAISRGPVLSSRPQCSTAPRIRRPSWDTRLWKRRNFRPMAGSATPPLSDVFGSGHSQGRPLPLNGPLKDKQRLRPRQRSTTALGGSATGATASALGVRPERSEPLLSRRRGVAASCVLHPIHPELHARP